MIQQHVPECQGYQLLGRDLGRLNRQTAVIINADDLGLSANITNAIIRLAEAGAITSASLIPVGHDFERAARWAGRQKTVSVGIHLCLSDGLRPITAAPRLVARNQRFRQLGGLALRAFCRKIPLDEIRWEWKAQIMRVRSSGIRPTHLDSHQHVHILPGVADVIVELAREEGLPVRHTAGPFGFAFSRCKRCMVFWKTLCCPCVWKSAVVRCLGKQLKRRLAEAGVLTVNAYVSPSSLCGRMRYQVAQGSVLTIAKLAAMTGGNIEWAVHPSDANGSAGDPAWMSRIRVSEIALLEQNAYAEALRKIHVKVTAFNQIQSNKDKLLGNRKILLI